MGNGAGWTDFLVAAAGASGALVGLVFVALSINLGRILALPGVSGRAAETILLLASALLATLLALIPGLAAAAVGIVVSGSLAADMGRSHDPSDSGVAPAAISSPATGTAAIRALSGRIHPVIAGGIIAAWLLRGRAVLVGARNDLVADGGAVQRLGAAGGDCKMSMANRPLNPAQSPARRISSPASVTRTTSPSST